ncbi:tetratricopeptide repeat protein [Sandarakinorhabdus sp.]|uniref:tetratricopeptide repeat protein n=1 Tax=Sandarakinorhabdus sp. TaxID=1916663 RepID=UPI00286E4C6B|nr:tetratricopeptide repeat protein [Sandarakinorhabdus sp.]
MRSPLAIALFAVAVTAEARTTALTQSPLHSYVLGRHAAADSELGLASRLLEDARTRAPDAKGLPRRTFEVVVAAGDQTRAFVLARELTPGFKGDADVMLVRLADAILRRDFAGAAQARSGLGTIGYAQVVNPIAEAWITFSRGDTDAALARLDPAAYSGFVRSYVSEQRAHMLAAAARWPEAAKAYYDLRASTGGGISFLRVGEADALAMAGKPDAALAALSGNDAPTVAARARLLAGKRIGALAPDARRAIGWMAARLAVDLSRERPVPLALLFARVGTFLAPDIAASWIVCGDVLARGNQRQAALAAYDRIAGDDALFAAARARRAEVLEGMGRSQQAGVLLQAATLAPDATPQDWTALANWYRRGTRYAEAAAAYDRVIALQSTSPDSEDSWSPYFLRGSMWERAGKWPQAESDLRAAFTRAPGEAMVLNYLGYSLLDRGEKLGEAVALIEKAADLRPGDGGIADSLGWSQYRRGQFDAAVTALERAWALEPGDPTITDHLGDAYWQVGRRIEARFRWRQALGLEPDAKLKSALQAKLDFGLDAALAMADASGADAPGKTQ